MGRLPSLFWILLGACSEANAAAPATAPVSNMSLVEAVKTKQHLIVKQWLKNGESPQAYRNDLLGIAISNNDPQTLALLLQAGAQPLAIKWSGSYLQQATRESNSTPGNALGCAQCIPLLMKAGGSPLELTRSPDILTGLPAQFADVACAKLDVIKVYAAQGFNLHAVDYQGNTMLHLAALCGEPSAVTWLVGKGLAINGLNNEGQTPLLLAVEKDHAGMVPVMLDNKADLDATDRQYFNETVQQRIAKRAEVDPSFADLIAQMEQRGTIRYLGDKLPPSPHDAELRGKLQIDFTRHFYENLQFLPPNLRFFAVTQTGPNKFNPELLHDIYATAYAVKPNGTVVKLLEVSDFSKLGVKLRSADDARQFVRFVSRGQLDDRDNTVLIFQGNEAYPVPKTEACWQVKFDQFNATEVYDVKVQSALDKKKHKVFLVTRYAALTSSYPDIHRRLYRVSALLRLRETVGLDGSYEQKAEAVPNSGLTIESTCMPR